MSRAWQRARFSTAVSSTWLVQGLAARPTFHGRLPDNSNEMPFNGSPTANRLPSAQLLLAHQLPASPPTHQLLLSRRSNAALYRVRGIRPSLLGARGKIPGVIGLASFVVVITVILVYAVLRDPPKPSFLLSSQNIAAEVVELFFI